MRSLCRVRRCRTLTRRSLSLGLLLVARLALAKDTDAANEASRHYEAGQHHYDNGDFARALKEFERAYELLPKPTPLFNIAKMYELQGQLPEALTWYQRYLHE